MEQPRLAAGCCKKPKGTSGALTFYALVNPDPQTGLSELVRVGQNLVFFRTVWRQGVPAQSTSLGRIRLWKSVIIRRSKEISLADDDQNAMAEDEEEEEDEWLRELADQGHRMDEDEDLRGSPDRDLYTDEDEDMRGIADQDLWSGEDEDLREMPDRDLYMDEDEEGSAYEGSIDDRMVPDSVVSDDEDIPLASRVARQLLSTIQNRAIPEVQEEEISEDDEEYFSAAEGKDIEKATDEDIEKATDEELPQVPPPRNVPVSSPEMYNLNDTSSLGLFIGDNTVPEEETFTHQRAMEMSLLIDATWPEVGEMHPDFLSVLQESVARNGAKGRKIERKNIQNFLVHVRDKVHSKEKRNPDWSWETCSEKAIDKIVKSCIRKSERSSVILKSA